MQICYTLIPLKPLNLYPPPYIHPHPQVPVASVSSGVHEAGKNIDKTEALFSQERDPRFAEMYTGISGCMTHAEKHTHINTQTSAYTSHIRPDSFCRGLMFLLIACCLCSLLFL